MTATEVLENHFEITGSITLQREDDHTPDGLYGRQEARTLCIRQRIRDGENVEQLSTAMISSMMVKLENQLEQWKKCAGQAKASYTVMVEARWYRLFDQDKADDMPHFNLECGTTDTFDPREQVLAAWCAKLEHVVRKRAAAMVKKGALL